MRFRTNTAIGPTPARAWHGDDDTMYPPVPWGKETNEWKGMANKFGPCPGCGVYKGEFHVVGCGVEQMPPQLALRPVTLPVIPGDEITTDEAIPRSLPPAITLLFRALKALDQGFGWICERWPRIVATLIVFWLVFNQF